MEKGYGVAADVWSLGVVLLEMAARRLPFENAVSQIELHDRLEARSGTTAVLCFDVLAPVPRGCVESGGCARGEPCSRLCWGGKGSLMGSGRLQAGVCATCSGRAAAGLDGFTTKGHPMAPRRSRRHCIRAPRNSNTTHAISRKTLLHIPSISFPAPFTAACRRRLVHEKTPYSKNERWMISSSSCPDTRRNSKRCSGDAYRPTPKNA